MNNANALIDEFARVFGGSPEAIACAPGRVNLIGEHTDYNEGFVLPMAINYEVQIAARGRNDRVVKLHSADFNRSDAFGLEDIKHATRPVTWSNYLRGVADVLQTEGYVLRGMDAVISGSVPRGAGLSSSAALELATITAFRSLNSLDIDAVRAAQLCQRAENEFVGVRCGIMDQMISSLGRSGHALLIDCRSLEFSLVPLPNDVSIVVTDSGVRRGLVESAYNERRLQCEAGARLLGVPALRDATMDMLVAGRDVLPPIVARRCEHVIAENQRVLESVAALKRHDLPSFGALMNASHTSMRDLFEVSTPQIDTLVSIQQEVPGCLGARLTGGGFGGCTVALVRKDAVSALRQAILTQYPNRTGKTARVYVCQSTDGARLI